MDRRKDIRFDVDEPGVFNNGQVLSLVRFDGRITKGAEGYIKDVSKKGLCIEVKGFSKVDLLKIGDKIEVKYYDNYNGFFKGDFIKAKGTIVRIDKINDDAVSIGLSHVTFNNDLYLKNKSMINYIETGELLSSSSLA